MLQIYYKLEMFALCNLFVIDELYNWLKVCYEYHYKFTIRMVITWITKTFYSHQYNSLVGAFSRNTDRKLIDGYKPNFNYLLIGNIKY